MKVYMKKSYLFVFFTNLPKRIEKKKIFLGTFNNGHVIVISAFGLIGTIRIKSKTKKRLSRPASTF
jgi:hypothetical protein